MMKQIENRRGINPADGMQPNSYIFLLLIVGFNFLRISRCFTQQAISHPFLCRYLVTINNLLYYNRMCDMIDKETKKKRGKVLRENFFPF